MTTSRRHRWSRRGLGAAVVSLGLTVTACSGSSSSSSGTQSAPANPTGPSAAGTVGNNLSIALGYPPVTLNPALSQRNPGFVWYTSLAYEPLIRQGANGVLEPALATSWKYLDTRNQVFQLTLRQGVKFADGTPVTAQAVVASLNYARKQPSQNAQALATITSVAATGPSTVQIKNSAPNPLLPVMLTQNWLEGDIISPAGLANPGQLGTETFGAGPYVLAVAQTQAGNRYVYTANPNYYNKAAQHWKQVTINVIPNINSAIQALQTGQDALTFTIDVQSALSAASSPDIVVYHAQAGVQGVNFMDRSGQLSKPLADVRVRQALNYAIDRKAIESGLFGKYATPTWNLDTASNDGYNPALQNIYPYDPAKAKALLAQAGYPNGFTLNMETQGFLGTDKVAQAIIAYWNNIGVKVNLTSDSTFQLWQTHVTGKQFPAAMFASGGAPMDIVAAEWLPTGLFNPFGLTDAQVNNLIAEGNAATGTQADNDYQAAMKIIMDQAWIAPVAATDVMYPASTKLAGISVTPANIIPDVATSVAPAA